MTAAKKLRPSPFLAALCALVLAPTAAAQHDAAALDDIGVDAPVRAEPWPAAVVELAESLPVQDGGRVKPLHTYAGFTLLRLNGKRSLETPDGERLTPVEWLLDTLFYPEVASGYEVFLVQNSEVIEALGLSLADKKKRDRYSFDELKGGIGRLFQLAREYDAIEAKDRSAVQQQLWLLAMNVDAFMKLVTHLDFGRASIAVGEHEELRAVFDGRNEVAFQDVLPRLQEVRALYSRLAVEHADAATLQPVAHVIRTAGDLTQGTEFLALLPPAPNGHGDEWLSPADVFHESFDHGHFADEHVEALGALGTLARDPGDAEAFRATFEELHGTLVGMAEGARRLREGPARAHLLQVEGPQLQPLPVRPVVRRRRLHVAAAAEQADLRRDLRHRVDRDPPARSRDRHALH